MQTETQTDINRKRTYSADAAHRLSLLAMREWQKAISGVIALPTAAALSTASAFLFGASIVERTFQAVELSIVEVGRRLGDDFSPVVEDQNARDARLS